MLKPVLTPEDITITKVDMVSPCFLVSYGLIEKTDNEKGVISGIWIKFPNSNTRVT